MLIIDLFEPSIFRFMIDIKTVITESVVTSVESQLTKYETRSV